MGRPDRRDGGGPGRGWEREGRLVNDVLGFGATLALGPYRRGVVLKGRDEIGRTRFVEDRIAAYERMRETGNGRGEP